MRKWLVLCGITVCLLVTAALSLDGRRVSKVRKIFGQTTTRAAFDVTQETSPAPILRPQDNNLKPQRLDAWEIIGPGGGGVFSYMAVSPHDPNLALATTDMSECFITENGGRTWRQFNLRWSCRYKFDPKLPNRIYSASVTAGLWRSDDRGRTWSLVYPEPSRLRGLWYVDDEAELVMQTHRAYGDYFTAFEVDPEDSQTLYGILPSNYLMISTDGGAQWRVLAEKVNGQQLFADPTSPRQKRRLFVVSGASTGVWDGEKYSGNVKIPSSNWIYGTAFGVERGGRPVLYTAHDFVRDQQGKVIAGGILAANDGVSWRSVNDSLLGGVAPGTFPEFAALGASLHNPNVLYVSMYHWNLPGDSKRYQGVIKTTDGGLTWETVRKEAGTTAPNMHDAWMSQRFGPDWPDQPLSIGVSPTNPDVVYTTDMGRIMRSTDGGKNWYAAYSQGTENGYTTTGLDNTTCYGIHFDPFDPKRMFISYTDIGLFRSEDGGKSWISSTTKGVPRPWVNTTYWVELDPAVKGKMWAAMSGRHDLPRMRMFRQPGSARASKGGVVVSEDGGKSWTVAGKDLPDMAATHILLDPKSPATARTLYVTGFGRGVFKSPDGGQTWVEKNNGLPTGEPLTWRMALANDGTLYVVTIRRSQDGGYGTEKDGWVFRSKDGGDTWARVPLPEGLNGPVSVTVDPKDPSRLYLSAWARYKLYGAGALPPMGGVFLSTNAGETWENVLDASRRIYDVTVDPRDTNVVYAAGFEASAWRSADRGLTWKRIRGYNFKDGHRVIPDPFDRSKVYIATFGSSIWHGPAEGDPNAVEDIVSPPSLRFNAQETGKLKK